MVHTLVFLLGAGLYRSGSLFGIFLRLCRNNATGYREAVFTEILERHVHGGIALRNRNILETGVL